MVESLVLITEDPEFDGGSSVMEYLVSMISDSNGTRDVYRGHDTQCAVASLLPGRLYTFQVKANNKAGVCHVMSVRLLQLSSSLFKN